MECARRNDALTKLRDCDGAGLVAIDVGPRRGGWCTLAGRRHQPARLMVFSVVVARRLRASRGQISESERRVAIGSVLYSAMLGAHTVLNNRVVHEHRDLPGDEHDSDRQRDPGARPLLLPHRKHQRTIITFLEVTQATNAHTREASKTENYKLAQVMK